jgi:hypothetical protein
LDTNRLLGDAESAARYAEIEQFAREFARLNTDNSEHSYLMVKNCMMAGASIAIAGLDKFKRTLLSKSKN